MQLDWRVRLGVALLGAVALAGAAWGDLGSDTVGMVLGIVGGLLGGVGLAGGGTSARQAPRPPSDDAVTPIETPLPRPRGGDGPLALLLALALGASLTACGAAPCQTERGIVSALDAGAQAAEAAIPDDAGDDVDLALQLTRGAVLLGQAAVDGCDLARDGAGWQAWVGLALEAAGGLAAMFGGAGPERLPAEPPPALAGAVLLLEAEAGQ